MLFYLRRPRSFIKIWFQFGALEHVRVKNRRAGHGGSGGGVFECKGIKRKSALITMTFKRKLQYVCKKTMCAMAEETRCEPSRCGFIPATSTDFQPGTPRLTSKARLWPPAFDLCQLKSNSNIQPLFLPSHRCLAPRATSLSSWILSARLWHVKQTT